MERETLTLCSLFAPNQVVVPYFPDMPMWQYLKNVIAHAYGNRTICLDKDGVSISSTLVRYVYESPSRDFKREVCFNYENRLTRLGDVIPPYGRLIVMILHHDMSDQLRGNASPLDNTRPDCSVCSKAITSGGHRLSMCGHSFHFTCLCQPWKCPLCGDLTRYDQDMLTHRLAKFRP